MQESYLCDKQPLDRHLTIRVPSVLMADLRAEKKALDFPYVSSLVRYLLSNRARTSGMYSKEDLAQINHMKALDSPQCRETRLSVKLTNNMFKELVSEQKSFGFKTVSTYIVFILERRFLKSGALRTFKNLESR